MSDEIFPYDHLDPGPPMTATECIEGQRRWFRDVAAAARRDQKDYLREIVAKKDSAAIFAYCCAQSQYYKNSMLDLVVFGWSAFEITEDDAKWVMRYYARLLGTRL